MSKRSDKLMILAATFTVGASVMAVEITASRLLAPYFGASMFVWTSLIVTVLLSLSFGYWAGGTVAEKNDGLQALAAIMIGSGVLLIAGVGIIAAMSPMLIQVMASWRQASAALFLGSLAVSFSAFALPVFCLAMASPVLLKAWTAGGGDVGKISGRYFAISTLGSVIGTLAPTLLTVPILGARHTVELAAALLIVVGLALLPKKRGLLAAILLPSAAFSVAIPSDQPASVIAMAESPYQLIRVEQEDSKRYLVFNEGLGVQSIYDPSSPRTGYYYDYYGLIPLLRPYGAGHRAAILGLAGGTIARTYGALLPAQAPRPRLTGVELDPKVIDIARRYMALDETGVETVNQDARVFLSTRPDKFDSIIVDAYSTQLYIAPHMVSAEFFALAASRLDSGGILALNVNAAGKDSPLLTTIVNTVAKEFRSVAVIPVAGSWNYMILASDEPIDLARAAQKIPAGYEDVKSQLELAWPAVYDPAAPIFTDDRAPVEFLTDSMILQAAVGARGR